MVSVSESALSVISTKNNRFCGVMLRSVDTWALRLCQYLPQGVKEEYTGIQSRNYGLKVNKVRGELKLARQAAQNKQEYYIPPVKKRGATSKGKGRKPSTDKSSSQLQQSWQTQGQER